MKKFLAMALAAVMVLALAACGSKNDTADDTGDAQDAQGGETQKLIVGFDAEFPPFGFIAADGTYDGFDLAMAKELCARLGWEYEAVAIDWNSKDAELSSGTINCIWNGFTYTGRENVEIVGDHMKLTQVFYNLIDNAIKYTPRGGRVHVELSKQGKTAVVRVADNGIGIPEEDQLHIFDRFYRVDKARSRETGGTGLGLSIVKQIVLLHDGNISVSSRENEGSTFTVELPLLQKTTGGKAHE